MLHIFFYIEAIFDHKTMSERANVNVSSEIRNIVCKEKAGGRRILRRFFKDDINTDYGIYPESEDVVNGGCWSEHWVNTGGEADANDEYEQQAYIAYIV